MSCCLFLLSTIIFLLKYSRVTFLGLLYIWICGYVFLFIYLLALWMARVSAGDHPKNCRHLKKKLKTIWCPARFGNWGRISMESLSYKYNGLGVRARGRGQPENIDVPTHIRTFAWINPWRNYKISHVVAMAGFRVEFRHRRRKHTQNFVHRFLPLQLIRCNI